MLACVCLQIAGLLSGGGNKCHTRSLLTASCFFCSRSSCRPAFSTRSSRPSFSSCVFRTCVGQQEPGSGWWLALMCHDRFEIQAEMCRGTP